MSHRGRIGPDSQDGRILAHMLTGAQLSPLEALDRFGCLRLAATVRRLKDAGYSFETRIERNGRSLWAVYRIAQQQEVAHG